MVGLPFLEMGRHVIQGVNITFLILLKAGIEDFFLFVRGSDEVHGV